MTTLINRYGEKVSVPDSSVFDSDILNLKVESLLNLDSDASANASHHEALAWDSDKNLWTNVKLDNTIGVFLHDPALKWGKGSVILEPASGEFFQNENNPVAAGTAFVVDSDNWQPVGGSTGSFLEADSDLKVVYDSDIGKMIHDSAATDSDLTSTIPKVVSFTVTADQRVFTLPSGAIGDVMMMRNGVVVSGRAVLAAGTTVTYLPEFNQNSTIDVGDVLEIRYITSTGLLVDSPVQSIGDLTDVTISAPIDGATILFDSDLQKWTNSPKQEFHVKAIESVCSITSNGAVTVQKGSVLIDTMTILDDESGWCTLIFRYQQGASHATAGATNGDILFGLPVGYAFDMTYYGTSTGSVSSSTSSLIPGSSGQVANGSYTNTLDASVYSSTQMRFHNLVSIYGTATVARSAINPGFYGLYGNNFITMHLRFKKA